jgi:CRP/FNR family transcriptional regulator, cyclic AMP receptor protein
MIDPNVFDDVPIFALLDADEKAVLAEQVSARHFARGEVVFKAGDPGGYAYVVEHGQINITITDMSNETFVVDVVDDGDICGMSSLLANAEHQTTAVAVEDTDAIEIDRNDITILITKRPMAGLDMMAMNQKYLRASHELIRTRVTRNPNEEIEDQETLGDRLADGVARFGGSWFFVICFLLVLLVYVNLNIFIPKPWDPYPFILLNLFLSMLAAIQAPVIMMSQNRQDAKDRVRSELDYRVNLKAELEIAELLQRVTSVEQKLETIDVDVEE